MNKLLSEQRIMFYPAWRAENLVDEHEYVFVNNDGGFTFDIREAVSFGNMRMAALFKDFRNPSPTSIRTFAVVQRFETFAVTPIEIPEYHKREVA